MLCPILAGAHKEKHPSGGGRRRKRPCKTDEMGVSANTLNAYNCEDFQKSVVGPD